MLGTSSTQSKWRSLKSSSWQCREKNSIIQEKINQATKHIKNPELQFTDKVVDNSVVAQRDRFPCRLSDEHRDSTVAIL